MNTPLSRCTSDSLNLNSSTRVQSLQLVEDGYHNFSETCELVEIVRVEVQYVCAAKYYSPLGDRYHVRCEK